MRIAEVLRSSGVRTALLLAASIAVSLVLGEIGVRIYARSLECHMERQVPPGLYRRDRRYGHTLTPGYRGRFDGGCWETPLRVSAEATRGGEIGLKEHGIRRILLVGDSYVFGLGVDEEDTLAALLPTSLASATPAAVPVEAINGGVPGWTTAQAALFIEEKAERLEADEVLLHIYLGNDVEERVRFEEGPVPDSQAERAAEAAAAKASQWGGIRAFLPSSHLLRAIRDRLRRLTDRTGVQRRPPDVWFGVFLRETPQRVREGYALMAADLARVSELSTATGIPVRAIIIPFWQQLTLPTEEATCGRLLCRAEEIDLRKPNREIAALLAQAEIPYLDLTEDLRRAYEGGRYGFVVGHWDADGTRVAAARIAAWLGGMGEQAPEEAGGAPRGAGRAPPFSSSPPLRSRS